MICYKVDVLEKLRENGFTSYIIRREKLLSENTLQKLRKRESISFDSLNTICILLGCAPSDIIDLEITPEEKEKYFDLLYSRKMKTDKLDQSEKD